MPTAKVVPTAQEAPSGVGQGGADGPESREDSGDVDGPRRC